MINITFENKKGDKLDIIPNENFVFYNSDGLDAPTATINTAPNGSIDGDVYIHSRVEKRYINLYFYITKDVAANKLLINKYVQTKKWVRMYVKTEYRDVYIDGYVADIIIDPHVKPTTMQISLEFPRPFFKQVKETLELLSSIIDNFHFAFAIENPIPVSYYQEVVEKNMQNIGERETGFVIEINFTGEVLNPAIYNRETGEFFKLNMGFSAGDKVTINTREGEKGVILRRDAVEQNIFNYVDKNSTWLMLETGDNLFTYSTDNDSNEYMRVKFKYTALYDAV